QPVTSTSIGSPARPSSSTTEPCASCSRFLIAILVRPSSTVSWTGMSRMKSISLGVSPLLLPLPKSWKGAAATGCVSAAGGALSAAACSAIAAPQSSIEVSLSAIFISLPGFLAATGQQFLYTQRILATHRAIAAFHDGDAIHLCFHQRWHGDGNDIAHFHFQYVAQGHLGRAQRRHQLYLGALDLLAHQPHPALVHFQGFALQRTGQDVAYRFDHRVRRADMHLAAA